jgi:hypothetical protein
MVNIASLSDEQLLALEQELVKLAEREGLPSVRTRTRTTPPSPQVAEVAAPRGAD